MATRQDQTRATASAPSGYVHVLAFCTGMAIMAIELCASRLVAPFFGTSTFVWTNIIGVIMIALAVGYVVGGRLADRRPQLPVLLRLLLAACAYLLVLPFVAPAVLRTLSGALVTLQSSFSFIFVGSLVAILLLFLPPILVLGMTSPFLIRVLAQQRHVGDAAGRIFGLSTLGSVIGTFLPVLIFIPRVGTGKTIVVFAAVLLAVVALGFRRWRHAGLGALALATCLLPVPAPRHTPGLVWAGESAYEYIEVYDRGTFRFLAYNDAVGSQTVANKAGPLTGLYYDYYSLLPWYLGRPARSALIIGLGGGVIANQLRFFHPDLAVTGVEIDPQVIDVARRYFALNPTTRVVNQDGRIFVSRDRGTYDVIVIDAYTQQVYIPFHLTTQEFFRQVKARLAADGLVAMNVSSAHDDSPLMRAICGTLRTVFGHVYLMKLPNSFDNVVVASNRVVDFAVDPETASALLAPAAAFSAATFRDDVASDPTRPLTDDRAPIERMIDWEMLARR